MLFELLTLRRPFNGENLGAIVGRIQRGEFDEAALRRAPHPSALIELAGRNGLLQPDPERRMRLDELLRRANELTA
eukprot:157285-Prymnesium_polylepis.1